MKKFIFFLFLSIASYAQTKISYSEIIKIAEGSQSEAVSILKSKGFNYSASDDNSIMYQKNDSKITFLRNTDGEIVITLFGNENEYISNNILNSIKNIGFVENESKNIDHLGFCSLYILNKHYIRFCDSIINYNNNTNEPVYYILLYNR
ncbi:hypothetical protein [Empedobacter sp.]|uniref:hypothetical protein n=1 Tax=Empedobacter sp. TaxID=1927715 RepID=UPI0028AA26A2|nr:hypothetical protein [Empedobacter sp.]